MSERTYSQVNTGISVREASFVRAEKACYKGHLML